MLHVSCKFGESKKIPIELSWVTSPSDTNYVLNQHEDVDQYGRRLKTIFLQAALYM